MQAVDVIGWLSALHPAVPVVLSVLGSLIVIAQVVVVLTPSKADDEAWDKIKGLPIIGVIISKLADLAPIQKK